MLTPLAGPCAAGTSAQGRRRRHSALSTAVVLLAGAGVLASFGLRVPEAAHSRLPQAASDGYTLVLLRHGESQWNVENKFTGWVDVDVSKKGAEEAAFAGQLMREAGIAVDMAFTSVLKRAIKTCMLALEEMDSLWIPVEKSYRLNERMYGDLQGADKREAVERFGEAQVKLWRRSFAVPPPPIADDHQYHPKLDPKYSGLKDLPVAESLKLTIDRVLPYWRRTIAPRLKSGKRVLVVAHGNSLRALVKYLDNIPDDQIVDLNIPTGVPLVYKLDRMLRPIRQVGSFEPLSGVYLGDQAWVKDKIYGVANQAKR